MGKHDVIHKAGSTVHNVLHCRQRRAEPRPQVICTENIVKFQRVTLRCASEQRHTDTQTHL